MPTLTPEQRREIEKAGDEPVRLSDPETHAEYVLLKAEVYERIQSLTYDTGPLRIEEQRAALRHVGERAGWDDPAMDAGGPSQRGRVFAHHARLALWGTAALDIMTEDDRRVVRQVWERLEELYGELGEDDRRRLGLLPAPCSRFRTELHDTMGGPSAPAAGDR